MKTIAELIAHLFQEKVELWLEGDRLRYRAPNQVMTPELLERIKREKETIKQFLRQNQPITKLFPLSIGQRALWFLHQMAPDSPAYNIAFSARICSPVNIPVLEEAFQSLVERHPLLRTTFPVQAGEPIQAIHSYQKVALHRIDATDWPETELIERVQSFYQSPFNLEQGPLMRIHLFTRHQQDHILLITQHHIISDAWSLWLLLDEFRLLYSNLEAGIPLTLNPLQYTYSDYVERQKSRLEGDEGEKLGQYWQKQLENSPPVLDLPFDRPRPPQQSYQGASYRFDFSPVLSERLKQLCQQENVTLFTLLLAAFQVLLHRYTAQEDILVGSPTSGRTQEEFAPVCGYFVNPIVLKANFANNPSFKSFLAQVRQTVLEGLTHQDYPFPLLVERLSPDRTASYSPIFQVDFVLQQPQQVEKMADLLIAKAKDQVVNWGGLALKPFEMPQQEGQFDLGLEMIDTGESLIAVWKYDTVLFESSTLVRMAEHFRVLLEQIVQQPEQAIGNFSILTEVEKHQILEEWNRTEVDYPLNKCIHQLFEEQVEKTPDNIAVVYEEQQLTYQELNLRANQLAHYLQELGVKPDTLVGICLHRSLEMVIGLLAILKAGGAYIPLDPTYPVDRITYMIDNSQMSLMLTSSDLLAILPVNGVPTVCLALDHPQIAAYPDSNPLTSLKPHHLAYVIYTSGSTGQPKGVMIPHQAISNHMFWMQTTFPLAPEDKVLQKTPFSFDASVWEFYAPLLVGGQLIMAVPGGHQDSRYLIKEIIKQGVTILQLVPSLLRMLLETEGLEQCSSLRRVFCGGEALERELGDRLQAILPVSLHNLYGPTEACIDATVYNYAPGNSAEIVPIGRPIANTRVYILDAYQKPVPIGVTGELHIGGTGLARGYLHRPDLTEQKFITSPFCQDSGEKLYKTGDLTRYLTDGQIEYLGRSDHQVKIRGFRIELTEIEAVLSQYPPIKQAIVLVKTDHLGARLVAYLLVSEDFSLDPLSLRNFLKKQLPDYMIPTNFLVLTSWPLTPNGKIDRQALLSLELTSLNTGNYDYDAAPRTPLEVTLWQFWTEILETENLGREDNFFESGGHSLLLMPLLNKINAHFSLDLPVRCLFEFPTVAEMARFIENLQSEKTIVSTLTQSLDELLEDAILEPSIYPSDFIAKNDEPAAILLTGATGFVGTYLLKELLQQTSANIYCLIRASHANEARNKLKKQLEHYDLSDIIDNPRLIPLVGDLAKTNLGISEQQWQELANLIDVIYHNGAVVNYTYPYSALKKANVEGTREILRLACQSKTKPLHFISTIGIISALLGQTQSVIPEDVTLDFPTGLSSGYAQSKWVAEKLVQQARQRGLPVAIYRLGRISGDSQTGVCKLEDALPRMLKGCLEIGIAPIEPVTVDITPIDYASQAVIHISQQATSLGQNFHIVNPNPILLSELINWIQELGYEVIPIPYSEWRTQIMDKLLNCPDNPLFPLLPLFKEMTDLEELGLSLDCQNTMNSLADTLTFPTVNCHLLHKQIAYLSKKGFF